MAKNLKFKIKNAQLAEALELDKKPIEQANLDEKKVAYEHSVTDESASEKPKVRKATSMPKSLQPASEKPSKEAAAEQPAPPTLDSKHESKVAKVEEALFKPLPQTPAAEEKLPPKSETFSAPSKESQTSQQGPTSAVEHKSYKESKEQQSQPTKEGRSYAPREDRPYTPRENRPYTPREDRPYTPREDRPYTPRENRPYTPREDRPYTPRENRPHTPREDRPHTPREDRPYTPRENRPYTPREDRPYTPREDRPYTPRENRPYTPRENRPFTPREDRPYTPRENRPYTPREGRPFVARDSREQGQDRESRPPREDRESRPSFRDQREARPQRESSFNRPLAAKMDFTPPSELKSEKKHHKQDHTTSDESQKKAPQKDFKEQKTVKKQPLERSFDSRDRLGLRADEGDSWKRKKAFKMKAMQKEEQIIRPTSLKVTLPILLKDLAAEMKYKVSDIIAKLFKQGIIVTLNDVIDDETLAQLIGLEFGCEIQIDRSEQERLNITEQTIRQEIDTDNQKNLITRAPVVAFMGHVDHGKTSLIDAIRKSNVAASEAGAITQHIGAFRTKTEGGDITILDTPGHEAFSAMRTRGASLTDVIVIVIAGDEGIKAQTDEAIQQAKNANVPIIVALNKCDKPNFKPEDVYRQLSERELLPEAWGGSTITVNCSATTKQGIKELLEMILLQADLLELKANSHTRARGTVIESEIQKGLGATATLLIQNGCLKLGDALVIDHVYGRIKTMHDEHGKSVKEALPSYPVRITGLSELPVAGCEFIVVSNEKEARKLTEDRLAGKRRELLNQPSSLGLESLLQRSAEKQEKKILNVIIKADVQGSVEAIKTSLGKIKSKKAELNILYAEVGEISESDIKRASTANATIIGFHTTVESHAESFIRELQVHVFNFDVIYHLVDKVKSLMTDLLDKIRVETQVGNALVQATFKSSQLGVIAGCIVNEGFIKRSNPVKLIRNKETVWQGDISSLKRVQEDVREVAKGLECGILLNNFSQVQPGDNIQSFEISYIKQEL